jgi:hypothetical protein
MQDEIKIKSALVWITNILNSKKIPFQISGGLAAKIYGSPRPLNDIDIDIFEENFINIYKDVKPYIIYGPDQYKDEKWDCYLMTLNYFGQEIDICALNNTKITTKDNKTWIPLFSDLKNINYQEYLGIVIPVIPKQELIYYKSQLNGDHQLIDINAII